MHCHPLGGQELRSFLSCTTSPAAWSWRPISTRACRRRWRRWLPVIGTSADRGSSGWSVLSWRWHLDGYPQLVVVACW